MVADRELRAAGWISPPLTASARELFASSRGAFVGAPKPVRELVVEVRQETTSLLRFAAPPCFITFGHEQDEEVELDDALDVTVLPTDDGLRPLLTAAGDEASRERQLPGPSCVLARKQVADDRVVLFGTGERLFAEEVFGHVRGLDGLMWRSLVWAAAKPFPMRCLPPFVSARMDDCNGAYSAFGYLDAMNRFGIKPNLGLFTDEMGPTDRAAAKRLFDAGGADFSMHAFRDDFYKARPNYAPFAELPDKPDLSNGGKETPSRGCHWTT